MTLIVSDIQHISDHSLHRMTIAIQISEINIRYPLTAQFDQVANDYKYT